MQTLEGLRIVVTRAEHQAEELAAPLRTKGAEALLLPMIAIAPPQDPEPLYAAAMASSTYDWILFTSANAVTAFANALPRDQIFAKTRIATIGAATRRVAEQIGFTVSLTPGKYVAESLIEALGAENLEGQKMLIPSAAATRDVLPAELRRRGADVHVVEAYRNIVPPEAPDLAAKIFRAPYPDWVTFASSSAVKNLARLVGSASLNQTRIASIGPITSATAREQNLCVTAEAAIHTVEGLVEAICSAH